MENLTDLYESISSINELNPNVEFFWTLISDDTKYTLKLSYGEKWVFNYFRISSFEEAVNAVYKIIKQFDEAYPDIIYLKKSAADNIPPISSQTLPDKNETVNHPLHYNHGNIECIDAIKASMPIEGFRDFCKGNVLKYVWRYWDKNGVEDLKKAMWYLNKLISTFEEEEAHD